MPSIYELLDKLIHGDQKHFDEIEAKLDKINGDDIEKKLDKILGELACLRYDYHRIREDVNEIEAVVNRIIQDLEPPPAAALRFTWGVPTPATLPVKQSKYTLFPKGGTNMPISLVSGQAVSFTVAPITSTGSPSTATLSGLSFTTSDSTVFSIVSPDPGNPSNVNSGVVTALTPAVSPDSAVITGTATATEPDGVTTESVSGSDSVTVTAAAPPPPPPPPTAASLAFSWGVPALKKK